MKRRKTFRVMIAGGFIAAALLLVGSVPKGAAPRRTRAMERAAKTAELLASETVSAERGQWSKIAQSNPFLLLRAEAVPR